MLKKKYKTKLLIFVFKKIDSLIIQIRKNEDQKQALFFNILILLKTMYSKSGQSDPITLVLFKKLSNLEILTTILAIISIFLLITLLLFSRIITFNPTGPLLPSEQNPYAFATLYILNDSQLNFHQKMGKISIFPDSNSAGSPSAFIKGFVNDLKPGTSHGVLILENTNFLLVADENDNQLFHFNPMGSLTHNCKRDSNLNTNIEGHMGDLGDIIANDLGQANIDKYVNGFNVNLIYGRAVVVLKKEDPCDSESFYLQKSDILAFGILGIYSEDKEEIELKRQMIEKKKKSMFKFQEKNGILKENKDKLVEEMKFQNKENDNVLEVKLQKQSEEKPLIHEEKLPVANFEEKSLPFVKNEKKQLVHDIMKNEEEILPVVKNEERNLINIEDIEKKSNHFEIRPKFHQDREVNTELQAAINAIETNESDNLGFAKTKQDQPVLIENSTKNEEKPDFVHEFHSENLLGKQIESPLMMNIDLDHQNLNKSDENAKDTISFKNIKKDATPRVDGENMKSLFSLRDNSDSIFKNLFDLDTKDSDPWNIPISQIPPNGNENKLETNETKKLIKKTNHIEKRLPGPYEADLMKRRRNLFKRNNFTSSSLLQNRSVETSLIHNRNFTDQENKIPSETFDKFKESDFPLKETTSKQNISSIFEKLANLIDSTEAKTQPMITEKKERKKNDDVFMGIDLGLKSKNHKNEAKPSTNELKEFQKNFENGVQENLQQRLKKLEEKL